jgi:hypothetical protein
VGSYATVLSHGEASDGQNADDLVRTAEPCSNRAMTFRRQVMALGLVASVGSLAPLAAGQESAPATPPAEKAEGDAAAKPAAGPGAGYTWSDEPKTKKGNHQRRRTLKIDPTKPLASSPSFTLLGDGRSTVVLFVNRKVAVARSGSPTIIRYDLPGTQIGVWNNTNPLVTTHFPTPLSRARLIKTKTGAQLELTLRSAVAVTHEIQDGPGRIMILKITLPAGSVEGSPAIERRAAGEPTPP